MKNHINAFGGYLLLSLSTLATDLMFTSGSVSDAKTVILNLSWPNNQSLTVQQLGLPASNYQQSWTTVGTAQLNSSGTGSFTNSNGLIAGYYGIYRAYYASGSTNIYTTNQFGATSGYLPPGTSLVGNPFSGSSTNVPSQLFRGSIESLEVYTYRSGSYVSVGSCSSSSWLTDASIYPLEGLVVVNSDTNAVKYIMSGIAGPSYTKSLVSGANLIVSPLYFTPVSDTNSTSQLYPQEYQKVDVLCCAYIFGGRSQFPVATDDGTENANALQCSVSKLTSHTGTNLYTAFHLNASGTEWLDTSNAAANVWCYLSEALWLTLPSNQTWTTPYFLSNYRRVCANCPTPFPDGP